MIGHETAPQESGGFRSPLTTWVFVGFSAAAAYYLVTEHTAHVFNVLPFALVLACPLMHFFMHHGGEHGNTGGGKAA